MSARRVERVDLQALGASLSEYMGRSPHAQTTQKAYAYCWSRWVDLCTERQVDPLNASVDDVLALLDAAQQGKLSRKAPDGTAAEQMWPPATVDQTLAAISDRYAAGGRQAPCDPQAPGYRLIRARVEAYRRAFREAGRAPVSAPVLDRGELPSVAQLAEQRAAEGLTLRLALLASLVWGLPPAALATASPDALRVVSPAGSTLEVGGRLLGACCDHSGPLLALGCLRCVLHEAAGRGERGILKEPGRSADDTVARVEVQLARRADAWPAANWRVDGPGGLVVVEGSGDIRQATALGLLLSTFPRLLAQLRTLAAYQLSGCTGVSVPDLVCHTRRPAVQTEGGATWLVIEDAPKPTRRYALGWPADRPDLEAVWIWLAVADAASTEADRPIFCPVRQRDVGLNPSKVVSKSVAKSMHRRKAGAIPQLRGMTSRSGRQAFAAALGAAGAGVMDTALALGLSKPETVVAYYPAASGERAARSMRQLDARLASGCSDD